MKIQVATAGVFRAMEADVGGKATVGDLRNNVQLALELPEPPRLFFLGEEMVDLDARLKAAGVSAGCTIKAVPRRTCSLLLKAYGDRRAPTRITSVIDPNAGRATTTKADTRHGVPISAQSTEAGGGMTLEVYESTRAKITDDGIVVQDPSVQIVVSTLDGHVTRLLSENAGARAVWGSDGVLLVLRDHESCHGPPGVIVAATATVSAANHAITRKTALLHCGRPTLAATFQTHAWVYHKEDPGEKLLTKYSGHDMAPDISLNVEGELQAILPYGDGSSLVVVATTPKGRPVVYTIEPDPMGAKPKLALASKVEGLEHHHTFVNAVASPEAVALMVRHPKKRHVRVIGITRAPASDGGYRVTECLLEESLSLVSGGVETGKAPMFKSGRLHNVMYTKTSGIEVAFSVAGRYAGTLNMSVWSDNAEVFWGPAFPKPVDLRAVYTTPTKPRRTDDAHYDFVSAGVVGEFDERDNRKIDVMSSVIRGKTPSASECTKKMFEMEEQLRDKTELGRRLQDAVDESAGIVRDANANAQKAIDTRKRVEQELDRVQKELAAEKKRQPKAVPSKELDRLRRRNAELEAENTNVTVSRNSATAELKTLRAKIRVLEAASKRSADEIASLNAETRTLHSNATATGSQMTELRREAADAKAAAIKAERARASAEKKQLELQRSVAELQADLDAVQTRVAARGDKSRFAKEKAGADARIAELTAELAEIRRRHDDLETTHGRVLETMNGAEQTIAGLRRQLAEAEAEAKAKAEAEAEARAAPKPEPVAAVEQATQTLPEPAPEPVVAPARLAELETELRATQAKLKRTAETARRHEMDLTKQWLVNAAMQLRLPDGAVLIDMYPNAMCPDGTTMWSAIAELPQWYATVRRADADAHTIAWLRDRNDELTSEIKLKQRAGTAATPPASPAEADHGHA